MTVDESTAFEGPLVPVLRELSGRDDVWLGLALATGVAVYFAYLATHPYPAYAGGLFLVMAEQVIANGYALPTTIPFYTASGVPFGYPPLMFYVTAVAHDLTGAPLVAISRILPGAVVIAYLVPYYGIARELLGSPRRAGLATVLFATTPTVLRWHISAGGLVRAPAMLLALSGVYVGLRLFKHGDRRWLAPATILFGLVVLTHPTYSVFFGMSYLLLYAYFDRSRTGLLVGATVALGGIVLAAPWWLTVVEHHGVEIFLTASRTHSGLAGGLWRLVVKLGYALDDLNAEAAYYYVAYAGGLYAITRRRNLLLPAWAVASSYVIGKNRFMFVAGSMLTAMLVFDYVVPGLRARVAMPSRRRVATVGSVVLVIVAAASVGMLYSASALPVAHENSPSQPQVMDELDHQAMVWAATNTAPDDEFVVLGDPGEWLPLYAHRTIVLGPWGWEWKQTADYYQELALFDELATCERAACLTEGLEQTDRDPEYVYVPLETYTVRGKQFERHPELVRTMLRDDRYELAYMNAGVMIFEVHPRVTEHRFQ